MLSPHTSARTTSSLIEVITEILLSLILIFLFKTTLLFPYSALLFHLCPLSFLPSAIIILFSHVHVLLVRLLSEGEHLLFFADISQLI